MNVGGNNYSATMYFSERKLSNQVLEGRLNYNQGEKMFLFQLVFCTHM